MGQQVAQCDVARQIPGSPAHDKAGQQFAKRRVQFELAALDKQHGRRCGGNHLGEAGHVVDGLRRHGRESSS